MKDEKEEESMEEEDISRRDFVRKAFQYAAAGAVLGGMAGLEGMNPPEAEADWADFVDFMEDAQSSSGLTVGFIERVINPETTDVDLKDWFRAQPRGYNVSRSECGTILRICRNMDSIPNFAHRHNTENPTGIQAIGARDIPKTNPVVPLTY